MMLCASQARFSNILMRVTIEKSLVWRVLSADDIAAAARLSATFGWPHRAQDWQFMLALGEGVAVFASTGELVATGMRWSNTRTGKLGLITVATSYQRRGIGNAIMHRLLADVEVPLMLHATEEGQGLYATHGFRRLDGTQRVRQLQGMCAASVASARVRSAGRHQYERIHALDSAAFGDQRPRLVDCLLRDGTVLVITDADAVTGFAIRRAFGRGALIGPVVAATTSDALELTLAALVKGFNRIDLTVDDPTTVAALSRVGLTDAGLVVPMVRGNWPTPLRPNGAVKFALASQAFG